MNELENMIKENFDTFLILLLIFFLLKEGVEDMEVLIALVALLFNDKAPISSFIWIFENGYFKRTSFLSIYPWKISLFLFIPAVLKTKSCSSNMLYKISLVS